MKQPQDTKTLDLLEPVKRGRGRPRVEHALTPAERAKRYRDNRRARLGTTVTENKVVTEKDNKVFLLQCEIQSLQNELDSYRKFHEQRAELDDLAQRRFDDLTRENKELRQQIEALEFKSDVTEKGDDNDALWWREMYEAEAARVAELEARIAAGRKSGWSYASITQAAEKEIASLAASASSLSDPSESRPYRDWAYGVYLGWCHLTLGWMADGDNDRLRALAENM